MLLPRQPSGDSRSSYFRRRLAAGSVGKAYCFGDIAYVNTFPATGAEACHVRPFVRPCAAQSKRRGRSEPKASDAPK